MCFPEAFCSCIALLHVHERFGSGTCKRVHEQGAFDPRHLSLTCSVTPTLKIYWPNWCWKESGQDSLGNCVAMRTVPKQTTKAVVSQYWPWLEEPAMDLRRLRLTTDRQYSNFQLAITPVCFEINSIWNSQIKEQKISYNILKIQKIRLRSFRVMGLRTPRPVQIWRFSQFFSKLLYWG